MAIELSWQRTDGAIPTYELIQDPMFYVEKWGLGSWAAYRGEQRIGEPGTYGTREEAQQAAEAAYRAERSPAPVDWAGRTFGQLSPDERARVTREAAGRLQDELQANAPAIAQVLADADVAEHRQIENEQQS